MRIDMQKPVLSLALYRNGQQEAIRSSPYSTCIRPLCYNLNEDCLEQRSKFMQPDSLTSTLIELIGIPSTSGHEEHIRAYLEQRLHDLGLSTLVDTAGNLIATLPGEGTPLLLNAHMDRVPQDWDIRQSYAKVYSIVTAKPTWE